MVADGLCKRRVMKWILVLSLATTAVILGGCQPVTQAPVPAAPAPAPAPAPSPVPAVRAPTVRAPAEPMPAFPWPPPPASAEMIIPDNWLPTRGNAHLADVADNLEHALKLAKYRSYSYSSEPHGFALVCQMEQIKSDATPSPEPDRWSTEMPSVGHMTKLEFIKALAKARPGYYRVIVFIVTDQPMSRTSSEPTGKDMEQWLAKGFNRLPEYIGWLTYGPEYTTTALVYEFKKISRKAAATFIKTSQTRAEDHLYKAGIYEALSRR